MSHSAKGFFQKVSFHKLCGLTGLFNQKNVNKDSLTTALARCILELEQLARSTHETEERPLYGKFLARGAIIMAKILEDKPIADDIDSLERLFGSTWFRDEDAYRRAYAEWDLFKSLLMKSIRGMTVNERLSNLGLFKEFDDAVAKKDELKLRAVLFKCFLDEENIEKIIQNKIR